MGQFTTLAKKLSSLQSSKAGPFDVCFCVGPFFDNSVDALKEEATALLSNDDNDDADKATKKKRINLPLPVYFMDVGRVPEGIDLTQFGNVDANNISNILSSPTPGDQDEIYLDSPSTPSKRSSDGFANEKITQSSSNCVKLANNLYRMIGTDIVSLQLLGARSRPGEGLVVAYTSSKHVRYGSAETRPLEDKAKHVSYIGCDLFLSSEWAQGIATFDEKTLTSADMVCRLQQVFNKGFL